MRRLALALLTLLLLGAASAPGASAHAQLEGSSPARDAVVKTAPKTVTFRFSEAVEGRFGAIKVFDARARRVDDGDTRHPDGTGSQLTTGLKPGLPEGSYTATYRVISADGHPVEGGVVFSIGRAGASSSKTIDELIGAGTAGRATKLPFGVVRSLDYLATALIIGLLAFLLWAWGRGAGAVAGDGADWVQARRALTARARRVLVLAAALGLGASLLGLVFEGAVAAGTTFWGALDTTILKDVVATRFGTVWAVKAGVYAVIGGAALVAGPRTALLLPAAALAAAPALAGHATTQGSTALLLPADVIHVVAMSVWVGGLIALLAVLPRATGELPAADRTRLLAAVLVRFSPVALACVLALEVTGTVQAIAYLTSFRDLTDDAFGRAILVKIGLVVALVGAGATNRQRTVPRLRQLAADGATPGTAGHLLRTTLRIEVALVVVVLAVTGALVGYAPPSATAGQTGPVSISKRLGPLQMEVTVEPARIGANTMHVYFFGAKDGRPFDGTKELTVKATERDAGVGPLAVGFQKTGPGHFTADRFQLVPGGTWTFDVTDRVSDFDEYTTSFTVKVAGR